jgi:hypothetical protein
MTRPTWATVVGILGIIFSCFGILSAGPEMLVPKMAEFQKQMFSEIQKEIETDIEKQRAKQSPEGSEHQIPSEFPKIFFDFLTKIWNFPEWYGTWSIITGILKLLVSAFYLFASIRLLQTRLSAIKLFYWAAGSSIALGALKAAVAVMIGSFMSIAMLFGGMFGVVIDIVLIIVVATGNKAAFYSQMPPPLRRTI